MPIGLYPQTLWLKSGLFFKICGQCSFKYYRYLLGHIVRDNNGKEFEELNPFYRQGISLLPIELFIGLQISPEGLRSYPWY